MAVTWRPEKGIFPIIAERAVGQGDREFTFLGTGFFIDIDGTLLTAKHVFTDHGLEHSHEFRVAMVSDRNRFENYEITQIRTSRRFDIALAKAVAVEGHDPVQIAAADAPRNRDVVTTEYSGTMAKRMEDGHIQLHVPQYTRKGHIICQRENNFPGPDYALTLELSFPAPSGASGAPVLVDRRKDVVGMIVANWEQQLLPSDFEPTQQQQDVRGGRVSLLAALAIHWSHLKEFVESGGRD